MKLKLLLLTPILAFGFLALPTAKSDSSQADVPLVKNIYNVPTAIDSTIKSAGDALGIPKAKLEEVHAQIGRGNCAPPPIIGCYSNETVYVYPEALNRTDNYNVRNVLAYEYMHSVWDKADKAKLEPLLMTTFRENKDWFDRRTGPLYTQGSGVFEGEIGSDVFYNEVHSVVCTDLEDSRLNSAMLNYCSLWIPNRLALVSYQ